MVVAIMLFMGGLLSVNYSFLYKIITRQELNRLALVTKQMQQDARIQAKPMVMNIYAQEHAYEYNGEMHQFPKQVKFGLLSNIRGSPGQPHKLITDPISFVQKKIIIHPSGTAQGGTLYLTDDTQSIQYALTLAVAPHAFSRMYVFYKNIWRLLE